MASVVAFRRTATQPGLSSYLDAYRAYLVGEKRSGAGIARYCWSLGRAFAWLDLTAGREATMLDLTHQAMRRYKEHLGEHCANATIINALASVRDFSIWAVAEGLRADDPTAGIKRPPKKRPAPDPLYEDEIAILLAALDEPPDLSGRAKWYWRRDALALRLFIFTGGRLSEIAGLRWEHIRLGAGVVTFRGDAGAKNGKDRTVPLHPVLVRELSSVPETRRRPHAAVVGTPAGKNLTGNGLAKRFSSWLPARIAAVQATLPHIHPHKLRHTFASVHIWHDTDLRTLQELLGHAQLGTTEHYVKVRDQDKRKAMSRFPSFND